MVRGARLQNLRTQKNRYPRPWRVTHKPPVITTLCHLLKGAIQQGFLRSGIDGCFLLTGWKCEARISEYP